MLGKLNIGQSVKNPDSPLVVRVLFLVVKHVQREESWEDPFKHMGLYELVAGINVDPVSHGLLVSQVAQSACSQEAVVSSQVREEAPE